jgi:uncharacterized membrane protein
MRILRAIWDKGVVGTFLAGIFALLPVIITIGVIGWVGGYVVQFLGPNSLVGKGLKNIGLQFVTNEVVGYTIGITLAIAIIWFIGLLVKSSARKSMNQLLEWPKRLPVVGGVYGTAKQIIGMLNKSGGDDDDNMKGMEVVYACYNQTADEENVVFARKSGGFLALSPPGTYQFGDVECRIIYIPTSPVPMTGGLMFWPEADTVSVPDMTVDQVMSIYLSLGVLAGQAVPDEYCRKPPSLSMLQKLDATCGSDEQ